MTHPLRSTLLTAMLAGLAAPVFADDGPTVVISGFGTGALTMTDTNDAQFIRPNQSAGAGKSARTGVDSNFGIQATATMNDRLSFTAQGLVRKNTKDDYGAELAWAFAKYKVTDHLDVRLGRVGAPVYMISDFRNVGYANTMLRPPAEVYRQVTMNAIDGIDFVYRREFGETTVTTQFAAGTAVNTIPSGAKVKFNPVTALHVIAEYGPMAFRLGRVDGEFEIVGSASFDGLITTLNSVGLSQVAKDFKVTDVTGSFTSLGFTLDHNDFLVQAEYAQRKTESRVVMDTTSYYAMFGYRIGAFTPYYYYGNIKQDVPRNYAGLPTTGPLAPISAAVNGIAKAALQSNNAIGVRWDFHSSAALKIQIDHITPKDGAGAFINNKPGFTGPVNVYAAGIDFVF